MPGLAWRGPMPGSGRDRLGAGMAVPDMGKPVGHPVGHPVGKPVRQPFAGPRSSRVDNVPMPDQVTAALDRMEAGQPEATPRPADMPRAIAAIARGIADMVSHGDGDATTRGRRRDDARSGAGRGGPRRGAAAKRSALVAEVIRHRAWRGEILRPRRRLDGARHRRREHYRERNAQGARPAARIAAQAHRLPSCHSAKLIRSIRNKSLVRAYQPRPCMRPMRRILSVAT